MSSILQSDRRNQPIPHSVGIDRAGTLQGSIWPNGRFGFRMKPSESYTYARELEDTIDVWCETGQRTLPLSVPSNSHSHIRKKPNRRGTNGLTAFGKKMVENGAFILDKRYRRERLSFGTLTLPSVDIREGWYISSFWAEIVRVFFQRLTRFLGRAGLPKRYVYVTEMQPKRSEEEGHPALHLHFIFVGRFPGGPWLVTIDDVVEMWSSVLSGYIEGERYYRKTKVLEGIKKSVEAYLGKYMSKGSDVGYMQPPDDMLYSLPSSWWGMDNKLRKHIKKTVIKSHDSLMLLYRALSERGAKGLFSFQGIFVIESPLGDYAAAWYGKIARSQLKDVWEILRVISSG